MTRAAVRALLTVSIPLVVGVCLIANALALFLRPAMQECEVRDAVRLCPSAARNGSIPQGAIREATFTITNLGVDALTSVTVTSSCGCSVLTSPKTSLVPGESVEITAKFNSSQRRGLTQVPVVVEYERMGTKSQRLLSVIADVVPAIICDHESLSFPANDPARHVQQFQLSARNGSSFEIAHVRSTHRAFEVRELVNGPRTDRHTFAVTFRPDRWEAGRNLSNAAVRILTTIGTEAELAVPLTIQF